MCTFAKVPLLRQIACWLRRMQKCCAGIHLWQRLAGFRKDELSGSSLCLRDRTSTLTFRLKAKPLQQLLEDAVVVASGVVILTESWTMFSLGQLLVCSRANIVSQISCAHASRSISRERSHLSLGFHDRFLSGLFLSGTSRTLTSIPRWHPSLHPDPYLCFQQENAVT